MSVIKQSGGLFFAEDSVLGCFGHSELNNFLGGDFDRFAGGGIPAHACLTLHKNKLAESGKGE